jgi:hypothetical protein
MADPLNDILSEIAPVTDERIEVDITPFLVLKPGETRTLVWANPSVPQAYQIAGDAQELLKRYLQWPPALAVEAATMAACHVAPQMGGLPPGLFYAQIASSKNDRLWHYLVLRLREAFPHLRLDLSGDELKKALAAPFISAPASSAEDIPSN